MLKDLTVSPARIRKIIARRSLILDPCNDAEASGILVCRNDFLPFRSIDSDRRGDHSQLPLPRSLRRVKPPRRNPTLDTHVGESARTMYVVSRETVIEAMVTIHRIVFRAIFDGLRSITIANTYEPRLDPR